MNGDFLGGGQIWPIGTSFSCPFPTAGAGGEPQQKAVTTASKTRGERGWKGSVLPCYYECWEVIHASSSFFFVIYVLCHDVLLQWDSNYSKYF